jgi:hypothetical protein
VSTPAYRNTSEPITCKVGTMDGETVDVVGGIDLPRATESLPGVQLTRHVYSVIVG